MYRSSAAFAALFVCVLVLILASSAFAQCPPPATPGTVAFCTPQNNSNIDGPVEVSAAANLSNLTLMRLYDNDQPVYEAPMSSFDTFLYVGSGFHHLVVVAYDGVGNAIQNDASISVNDISAGQPCGFPLTDQTVNFCFPVAGKVVGSPVTVSATARWDCCSIGHIRLYMDDQAVYDADQPSIFTQLPLSPGSHHMVAVAWNNQGQYILGSAVFSVASNSCSTTSAAAFCWPLNNDTIPTPVQVSGASAAPGLTLIRVYDNDQQVYQTTNPTFTTKLNIGQGLHHLVMVAYDNTGNAFNDNIYVRVTNTGTDSPCGIPDSGRDINFCAPAENSTVASPVTVSARALWNGQNISHIRIYMDYQDVYDADYQELVHQQFTLASGGHYLVAIVWDNNGDYTAVSRTFFVQ